MTSHELPLITIGVTCYNAAATIERALESALQQDWPNIEVVVVDDASEDGSLGILEEYSQRDRRIRHFSHRPNLGCAAARNTILREARGAFVAFFDDDDSSSPDRLSRQFERIVDYEKQVGATLVACYTSGVRYYPNGYALPMRAIGSQPIVPIGTVLVDYILAFARAPRVFFGAGTPSCSLMARTATFGVVGGFDESMRRQEDADFAVRLGLMGGHFIGTQESLLQQYVTSGSEKDARVEHESLLLLLRKNRDYLERKGLYDYMLGWSEIRYRHFNRQPLRALLALVQLGLRFPARTARHFFVSAVRRYRHEQKIGVHG